ncbi:TRAP transporter permease [Nitratifractor sp.]
MLSRKRIAPILTAYAAAIAVFHYYVNMRGGLSDLWFNAAHFSFLASLGFLIYPGFRRQDPDAITLWDLILALLALVPFFFLMATEESIYSASGSIHLTPLDLAVAGGTILLALEIVRRTTGWIIPILMIAAISYVLFAGNWISGVFAFAGMSVERFLYRAFYTGEGLFGFIANISASYVFMFMLFAAFLMKSGAGDFIVDLSRSLTSRFRGGAGHVAVFSSALMGTISGSAVANTVSTGSITIPMMIRNGFKPIFAAAVETAASTGGQIMPPIMGAGVFVMAQMTQIPFTTIVIVSILPAILYFSSISFYIHIHAKRHGIAATGERLPVWPILREGAHFFIPLAVLMGLLIKGFTPTYAAGISIPVIVAASWLTRSKRMSLRDIVEALAEGTRNMIVTGVLLVSVGIIVGIINISGIGVTFSQLIMEWSGKSLMLALVLVAIASLFLGMGLPVTASYIVLAVLSAPALLGLMLSPEMAALVSAGVTPPEVLMYLLAAHLIIFWLSQDSNLTPPVCLAAFAAAGIAQTPPMRTGLEAWKLGKGLYIIPILFAFSPLVTGSWPERFEVFAFAMVGILAFAATVEGFWDSRFTIYERLLFALATVLLLSQDKTWGVPDLLGVLQISHLAGLLLLILVMLWHKARSRKLTVGD